MESHIPPLTLTMTALSAERAISLTVGEARVMPIRAVEEPRITPKSFSTI